MDHHPLPLAQGGLRGAAPHGAHAGGPIPEPLVTHARAGGAAKANFI